MLSVATANVNGIRAAVRRGMNYWLADRRPDVLTLQEVRAGDADLGAALGPQWHFCHQEAAAKGRAGVAVAARQGFESVRLGMATDGAASFDATGRWVEADLALDAAGSGTDTLTVISAYVHTGSAGTPRQDEKYAFMAAIANRMTELAADGRHVLLTGDLNIAHREQDLKNWRGNRNKAGFLPQERAWLDDLFGPTSEPNWVDVTRALVGEGPGPYTWWTWRGQAFDNDTGWRIDYQIANPELAARARKVDIGRARTYDARWSDHAPVTVDYDIVPALPG